MSNPRLLSLLIAILIGGIIASIRASFGAEGGVELKQILLLQRSGGRALIRQGRDRVVFKPCPPVDPTNLHNWRQIC